MKLIYYMLITYYMQITEYLVNGQGLGCIFAYMYQWHWIIMLILHCNKYECFILSHICESNDH